MKLLLHVIYTYPSFVEIEDHREDRTGRGAVRTVQARHEVVTERLCLE